MGVNLAEAAKDFHSPWRQHLREQFEQSGPPAIAAPAAHLLIGDDSSTATVTSTVGPPSTRLPHIRVSEDTPSLNYTTTVSASVSASGSASRSASCQAPDKNEDAEEARLNREEGPDDAAPSDEEEDEEEENDSDRAFIAGECAFTDEHNQTPIYMHAPTPTYTHTHTHDTDTDAEDEDWNEEGGDGEDEDEEALGVSGSGGGSGSGSGSGSGGGSGSGSDTGGLPAALMIRLRESGLERVAPLLAGEALGELGLWGDLEEGDLKELGFKIGERKKWKRMMVGISGVGGITGGIAGMDAAGEWRVHVRLSVCSAPTPFIYPHTRTHRCPRDRGRGGPACPALAGD